MQTLLVWLAAFSVLGLASNLTGVVVIQRRVWRERRQTGDEEILHHLRVTRTLLGLGAVVSVLGLIGWLIPFQETWLVGLTGATGIAALGGLVRGWSDLWARRLARLRLAREENR